MTFFPDGNAIVYCEGAFNTPNGKTAHGLVRFTKRYKVLSVIDKKYAGNDAGTILDGRVKQIPVLENIESAIAEAEVRGFSATHFVIGLAPDGGRLSASARAAVKEAIQLGMHVDCGLHDYLSDDVEIAALSKKHQIQIRDVRKSPPRRELHFFEGKIEQVDSFKIAVLGTDSAVGKRTTAWLLVNALEKAGYRAEMIGTGQTAWMQGVKYGLILDSLINDFVSGEIEHAVWSAWHNEHPDFIIIEGQGSLMNPAYPGGFEILAAGRPDVVIVQHAPQRRDYDGFPGYPIHPIEKQIQAIELLSGKPVIALTLNHENIPTDQFSATCEFLSEKAGLPVVDMLVEGAEKLITVIESHRKQSV
jgi:uncharacterized NAD-dependent epimerase/dehydratase family protein